MIPKLTRLPDCPEWPMLKVIYVGHWTNAIVEFFGEDANKPPTHMHVYNTKKARKGFQEGKFTIPPTVTTVSYPEGE